MGKKIPAVIAGIVGCYEVKITPVAICRLVDLDWYTSLETGFFC